MLLAAGETYGLQVADVLLLADQQGVLARAEVDELTDTMSQAKLTWFADPLAEAWFVANVGPLGQPLPSDARVINERLLRARVRQLAVQIPTQEDADG